MAYKGDSLAKKLMQAPFRALGYKIVRLKAYEARMTPPAPDPRSFDKLFCIGFNKTATTTLEAVLRDLNLRLPKQLEQEEILRPLLHNRGYDRLKAFVSDYDAVQDLPFSQFQTYVACDALFPNSKFILTTRDPEQWVDSYIGFYCREFGLDPKNEITEATFRDKSLYLAPGYVHEWMRALLTRVEGGELVTRWDLAFDKEFLLETYQRRNDAVRRYFAARPDDLLVLDPTCEKDTGRLLRFLGREDVTPGPFPRLNAG